MDSAKSGEVCRTSFHAIRRRCQSAQSSRTTGSITTVVLAATPAQTPPAKPSAITHARVWLCRKTIVSWPVLARIQRHCFVAEIRQQAQEKERQGEGVLQFGDTRHRIDAHRMDGVQRAGQPERRDFQSRQQTPEQQRAEGVKGDVDRCGSRGDFCRRSDVPATSRKAPAGNPSGTRWRTGLA